MIISFALLLAYFNSKIAEELCLKTNHILSLHAASVVFIYKYFFLQTLLVFNARFLGLCQMHKGRRFGVGIGGFMYREGCWEEAHA